MRPAVIYNIFQRRAGARAAAAKEGTYLFEERNVFITGGAGFIMSHVAERLADAGKRLVLYDNLDEHVMNDDMRALVERKNVRFVRGDIRDREAVVAAMQGTEVVYHFAAVMGTSARFRLEIPTVEINVIGTLNVLDAALAAGVKYFVHPPRPALTEWLTPYIISKIAQTQFTAMYHRTYGLPTIGLNIANCYGPRERSVLNAASFKAKEGKKLVATAILAALDGEQIPVFGDGEQAADYVYIDDVVDACIKAVRPAAVGKVYEIGTGVAASVNEVVREIIALTGSRSAIEYLPMRTGEVKLTTVADNAAARADLQWEPRVTLREGLMRTIPYYDAQRPATG
jgi:nucleoside-diphosphate-sugar epimerase